MDKYFPGLTNMVLPQGGKTNYQYILVVGLILFGLNVVHAAENYYGKHSAEHLRAVEKHHMNKARVKSTYGDRNGANPNSHPKYAWGDIEFMLRHFPNHPKALKLAVVVAEKTNEAERAEKLIQKAISTYPGVYQSHLFYGYFLHRKKRLDDAINQYKKSIEIYSENSETHYNIGLAYAEKKMYKQAKEHAIKAYELGFPLPGLKNKLKSAGAW